VVQQLVNTIIYFDQQPPSIHCSGAFFVLNVFQVRYAL